MATRQGEASVSNEDGTAVSETPLDALGKAEAAADAAAFVAGKLEDLRKAVENNKDSFDKAFASALTGVLNGLTAVPYVGIVAQMAKSVLEHVHNHSAVPRKLAKMLRWFQEQDLDRVLGSVPQGAASLLELKKTMVEADLIAQTIKGKGWGNRFFLAAPYEAELKGKLGSLKEVRANFPLEATCDNVEMLISVLALLQSSRPEATAAKHNVPEVGPFFVGREEVLKEMSDALWGGAETSAGSRIIVCLWGIEGIGKTELACKYSHENLSRYGKVLWVDVQRKGAQGGYAASGGDVLGLTQGPGEQLEDYVKRVRLTLENQTEPFLLVFDGAGGETLSELQALLPGERQACHVLVTTADDLALRQHGAVPVAVESLGRDEAQALLKRELIMESASRSGEILDEVAKRLGYLTIALTGAASLLERRLFERNPFEKFLAEVGELGGVGPANRVLGLNLRFLERGIPLGPNIVVLQFAFYIAMVSGWFGEGPVRIEPLLEAAKRLVAAVRAETEASDDEANIELDMIYHSLPTQRTAEAEEGAEQKKVTSLTFHVLFLEYVRRQDGVDAARAATLATVAGMECAAGTLQQFRGVWNVVVKLLGALDRSELENARRVGAKYAGYLLGDGGDCKTAEAVLESGLETLGEGSRGWEWRLQLAQALNRSGGYARAAEIAEGVVKEVEDTDAAPPAPPAPPIERKRKQNTKRWLCCFGRQDGGPGPEVDGGLDLVNTGLVRARAWQVQATIHES
ncbi:hypothetical protein KFL_003780070 [Klebsormidium nitens]|uniref:NB-ARC domain-containing protein n=1 Tax=Klebsormidium nitens TaxID=105231 RepID=A0A1Y1IFE9_KLENI|nr:hypothetical protein KFL_003780070 [Klebsormidium nitens]|eukprot:GAQ87801.1 hypothetical protein KFL_003780070 [Klebsormidium nitens]